MMIAGFLGMWLVALFPQVSTAQVGYVPFCEIVQNPERYDLKSVFTSGIFAAGPEFSDFFDPSCQTTPERDVGTLPVPIRDAVLGTGGWKRLSRVLDKDRRAFVVVRGVFDAYKRSEDPPPADSALQEVLKTGNSRFGHLNFRTLPIANRKRRIGGSGQQLRRLHSYRFQEEEQLLRQIDKALKERG